jgi:hypothetical protein
MIKEVEKMGAWGVGLYQDDVTCDVRSDYVNRLKVGLSNIDATKDLIELNLDFIEDPDDGPLFWLALADTQWKYGRLLPEIKEIALEYIRSGTDLEKWKENKKQYEKRKKVLDELEERLNSPMPPEKKVSKLVISKAKWKIGDVLLYRINNADIIKHEIVTNSKWNHKYVMFRIIGVATFNIGRLPRDKYYHEMNIVGLYNWVGEKEVDLGILEKVEFLKEVNVFGKKTNMMRIFSLSRNQLKLMNLLVVAEDENYISKHGIVTDPVGITWGNERNLDYDIVMALQEAEEDNILIDQTK